MNLRNPLIKSGLVTDRNVFMQVRDEILLRLIYRILRKSVAKDRVQVIITGNADNALFQLLAVNMPLVQFAYIGTGLEVENIFKNPPVLSNLSLYKNFEEAERRLTKKADLIVVQNLHTLPDDIGFLKWIQTFDIFSAETQVLITAASRKRKAKAEGGIYTAPMLTHYCNRAGFQIDACAYFLGSILPFKPFPGSHLTNGRKLKASILKLTKVLLKVDFGISLLLNQLGFRGRGWYTFAIGKKYS